MNTRGKTIFAVGSVILIVAIRVLFILVHKNALALLSSKFGVFLIHLFDIALVSLSIWGMAYLFYLFIKKIRDVWFFASSAWLMFLWCPLLFFYVAALWFPNNTPSVVFPLILLLSGIIGALPLTGVNLSRRWLLGALTGFFGFIYSFIIGFSGAVTVKDSQVHMSIENLEIAVIFAIGGLIGGLIADKIHMKRVRR